MVGDQNHLGFTLTVRAAWSIGTSNKRARLPRPFFAIGCPQQEILQDKFIIAGSRRRTANQAFDFAVGGLRAPRLRATRWIWLVTFWVGSNHAHALVKVEPLD
jgi:hypothetical protein